MLNGNDKQAVKKDKSGQNKIERIERIDIKMPINNDRETNKATDRNIPKEIQILSQEGIFPESPEDGIKKGKDK
jgi:hypothetical protein